jgi:hypothetical protein
MVKKGRQKKRKERKGEGMMEGKEKKEWRCWNTEFLNQRGGNLRKVMSEKEERWVGYGICVERKAKRQ